MIVAQLIYLDGEDPGREINLYINSPGGVVSAGLAIYDTMQYLRAEVNTFCVGLAAASMAAVLLMAGTPGKRVALPHARIMIHQGSVGLPESAIPDIEVFAREQLRLTTTMTELMARHAGQPFERVRRDTERDYYMTAEEARDYGIVDHVIKPAALAILER